MSTQVASKLEGANFAGNYCYEKAPFDSIYVYVHSYIHTYAELVRFRASYVQHLMVCIKKWALFLQCDTIHNKTLIVKAYS